MSPIWTRAFTLAVAATFAVFVGFYLLIPALPPYAAQLGASKSAIGIVIGIYSIAAVTVRLTTGHLIDRGGRKRFLMSGLALFAAASVSYRFATTLSSLIALRIVHGIGWAWVTTGFTALVADITPPARRG
ncbi:MAG TPA: MFS transporter, partial [Thermoanaerobaculia bacterium]